MNNSQNVFGNNNNVSNNQFHFSGQGQEPDIIPFDKSPITIFNKQVKTFWLLIGAVVSFAANLLTIYTSLKNFNSLEDTSIAPLTLPAIFFFFFMFLYIPLSTGRLFKFKGLSIASYNGSLFFEKYKGTCPCGGKLRFFQNFKTGQGYAQCLANDDHIFSFSPKIFDKENYATA